MATRGSGKGVRIPVGFDTEEAERGAKELESALKGHLTPVVDVVNLGRQAYDALYKTIGAGVGILKEAIEAASEGERIERRTITALQLRNQYEEGAFERLKAANLARQQQLGIEDDLQLQIQGTAAALGVQARHLDLVTRASLSLSEITGQTLDTSLLTVVKAYEGNVTSLQRMGIQARSADEALSFLAGKMGLVEQSADTFSGRVKVLESNWGDLLEELGNAVIKNEDVKKLLEDVNSEIRDLTDKLAENGPEVRAFFSSMVEGVRETAAFIRDNRTELTMLLELAVAMKGIQAGGGLVGAAKQLGAGGLLSAGGGLLTKGVGALGGAVGVGGSLLAGSAFLGPIAQLLFLKDLALDPTTLKAGIQSGIPLAPGNRFQDITASYAGPTVDQLGADPNDYRVRGAVEDVDFLEGADIKAKPGERAAKAQKAREELHKEAQKRLKDVLSASAKELEAAFDEEEKREKEHKTIMTRLRVEEIEARSANNQAVADLDLERLVADRETKDAQIAQLQDFTDNLTQIGVTGLGSFFSNTTQVILAGKGGFEGAMKSVFGMMLSMAGQSIIALGAAALAAASSSTAIPFLWPIFGGPIGVGGSLGIIAAGGILTGAGAALSASATSATSAARAGTARAPTPAAPRARGETFADTAGAGVNDRLSQRGRGVVNVINVNLDKGVVMGTDYELARWLADLLGQNAQLQVT